MTVEILPTMRSTRPEPIGIDIELQRVTKVFDATPAVDQLSLQVEQGKMLALLGPSGCGKTTTLRLIAGFEEPTGGDVLLRGQRVNEIPPYRRGLGMVFQNYALFPHMRVFDNVAFGLRMRRVPRGDIPGLVNQTMDLVQLAGLAERYPHELSGGQQQRVALARAIIGRPTVLLLDEPLAALDKKLREEMQVELRQLQRRLGITTIFVTHDQEEALTLADEVVVMRDGRIEQQGEPSAVYERPRNAFVATFLGSANLFRGSVVGTCSDYTCIRTAEGLHILGPPLESQPDGQVAVCVRPEKVRLGRADHEGLANRATGIVETFVYQGPISMYRVRLESGHLVQVSSPNHAPETPGHVTVGSSVELHWTVSATHYLDDPQA